MSETILAAEPTIRLAAFLGILAAMPLWEVAAPRRRRDIPRVIRWTNNLALVVLDTAILRLADITPPAWRGSAIGIYRFWRDLGYAIGALGLGLAASLTGAAEAAFWFVAISMFVSGGLLFWLSEETHPRLNPALEGENA